MLTKKVYGIEKRSKAYGVNQWDCQPTSRKTAHPERKLNLRNRLVQINQMKTETTNCAVFSAKHQIMTTVTVVVSVKKKVVPPKIFILG